VPSRGPQRRDTANRRRHSDTGRGTGRQRRQRPAKSSAVPKMIRMGCACPAGVDASRKCPTPPNPFSCCPVGRIPSTCSAGNRHALDLPTSQSPLHIIISAGQHARRSTVYFWLKMCAVQMSAQVSARVGGSAIGAASAGSPLAWGSQISPDLGEIRWRIVLYDVRAFFPYLICSTSYALVGLVARMIASKCLAIAKC
jgi:hypothetical protein